MQQRHLEIKRYYKLENQFQANFTVQLDENNVESIVVAILRMANQLWHSKNMNWTFIGPFENEQLQFECILNNHNDNQTLKWAHIQID